MIRSVFISRAAEQVPDLCAYCEENGIRLTARSLIRFEGIPAHPKKSFDIIFFPSIRAATFFLEHNSIPAGTEVACIGEQTAAKLRQSGINPAFIGEHAGDPESVARSFATFAAGKQVLIPSSTLSNRTIQQYLGEEQIETLTVYSTLPDPVQIDGHDLYVFSSPSNLSAFLEVNTIPEGAQLIAWGKTTLRAMEMNGLKCSYSLNESSTSELIDLIKKGDQR